LSPDALNCCGSGASREASLASFALYRACRILGRSGTGSRDLVGHQRLRRSASRKSENRSESHGVTFRGSGFSPGALPAEAIDLTENIAASIAPSWFPALRIPGNHPSCPARDDPRLAHRNPETLIFLRRGPAKRQTSSTIEGFSPLCCNAA
jgi:hypothetical protein